MPDVNEVDDKLTKANLVNTKEVLEIAISEKINSHELPW